MQQATATQPTSRAPRASHPRYLEFAAVAAIDVAPEVILDIVETETAGAVADAVSRKDKAAVRTMVAGYLTRRSVAVLGTNSLKRETVMEVLRRVGWKRYFAVLTDPAGRVQLTQWITQAALDAAPSDGAQPALAPHATGTAAADEPPPARLPPPGPRLATTSARPAPAGAVNAAPRPAPPRREPSADSPPARANGAPSEAEIEDATKAAFEHEPVPDAPDLDDPRRAARAQEGEHGPNEHVYNKGKDRATGALVARSALCVEAVTDKRGNPTVKFEGANGPHPSNAERYNWHDKVIFYAHPDELQRLLCVMFGYLEEVAFFNHGPNNNKYLKLKRQEDSLYCTIGEGKEKSAAIKIPPASATRIAVLLLRQFKRACFDLDEGALHMVLARLTAPLIKGEEAKKQARA
jgi:hypothetical protein